MKFSDLTECPFCGSKKFCYKQTASGYIVFGERFDGKEAHNEDMYDNVDCTGGAKCYCRDCFKYLGNRFTDKPSKRVVSEIRKQKFDE